MQMNVGEFLTRRAFLSPQVEAMVEPAAGGRRIDFREELPRHDTGKLYKRLLRDEYWAKQDKPTN